MVGVCRVNSSVAVRKNKHSKHEASFNVLKKEKRKFVFLVCDLWRENPKPLLLNTAFKSVQHLSTVDFEFVSFSRVPTPFLKSNSRTFQALLMCIFKLFQHLTDVLSCIFIHGT